MNIYLARQPVFDTNLKVVAYELLYRSGDGQANIDPRLDVDVALSRVVIDSVMQIGLGYVTGGAPALLNVSRAFLLSADLPPAFSKDFMLEILEHTIVDDSLLRCVRALKRRGYRFALDDFVFSPQWEPLVELADIIKIDVLAMDNAEVEKTLNHLHGFKGKLLAEKVEDYAVYEHCRAMGFDYFQGYFLARPKTLEDRRISPAKMTACRLLNVLAQEHILVDDFIDQFNVNPSWVKTLILLLNQGVLAPDQSVTSVPEAVSALGLEEVKLWATLVGLCSGQGKPHELLTIAVIRSKMCHFLAKNLGRNEQKAFTVGLLSVFEALMDVPLATLLELVHFNDDIVNAVRGHYGPLGELLGMVLDYEAGKWECLAQPEPNHLFDIYLEALGFMKLGKLLAGETNRLASATR